MTQGTADKFTHRDGLWWHEVPLPRRWHRCRTQTTATLGGGYFERCACGGMRLDGGWWFSRNSRRKEAR